VLFFVSVGMLFDPGAVLHHPFQVIGVLVLIVLVSPLVAFALLLTWRYPLNTALTVGAGLAQIGEFSFILAALGVSLGLMPVEGQSLILAGALISMGLNPLLFRAVAPAQEWIRRRSRLARLLERPNDPLAQLPMSTDLRLLTGHVVLVGYGRVGFRIAKELRARGISLVVAEQNRELVEALRAEGIPSVSGDAADPPVLIQAHVTRARVLVIATPETFPARRMIETARLLNPGIHIVIRTHSDEDAAFLERERADKVFMGEHELALGMTRHVLEKME
jgi:CPA2 family monovalent cation:H+ antiporter-2